MTRNHTPTPTGEGTGIPELPWALYPSPCEGYVYVGTAATTDEGPSYPVEVVLGEPIPLAFGELIVHACNCHDDLAAAVEAHVERIDRRGTVGEHRAYARSMAGMAEQLKTNELMHAAHDKATKGKRT